MGEPKSSYLRMTDKEKEQVVKARRDGVSCKDIASRFGIGARYVYDLCTRAGFPTKVVKHG